MSPDSKSLTLDSKLFQTEEQFWSALQQRVESCKRWSRQPEIFLLVTGDSYPLSAELILAVGRYSQNVTWDFYDPDTGQILTEPSPFTTADVPN